MNEPKMTAQFGKNGIATKLSRWFLKKTRVGEIDGISICDGSVTQNSSNAFLVLTQEAMALVKAIDARRYRRICRHIDFISNSELISSGNFSRGLNICRVDFAKSLTSGDPLRNLRYYACLLVHEATHGLIYAKGISYAKETRERIELLCKLEEYRFMLRFEPGYADANRVPFDAAWYKWYWESSRKVRRAALWERLREAFRLRKKTYDAVPKGARACNGLGLLHRRTGEPAQAISYFSHAIQLDPAFAEAYRNRGYEFHLAGRYDEALADYNSAIAFGPDSADAYNYRGLTYRHLNENNTAIADYNRAVELNPQFAMAYNNRAYAFFCKRQSDAAFADFARALQIDPKLKLAYINRGRIYRDLGDYEKAMADYTKLIELYPKYASAYNNLAWLLVTNPKTELRDGKTAVEYATKACELSRWENASSVNTLALAHAEAGDFENAAKRMSQYLECPGLNSSEIANAKIYLERFEARRLNP